jgi:hypothetical protein
MIVAVDWLLDSFATTINVMGDIVGAGRIARLHIFKPKITIWLNFRGSCNGRCILWPFGTFYGHLVHFVAI